MAQLLNAVLDFTWRLGAIVILLFTSSIALVGVGYFCGWTPKETADLMPYAWVGLLVGRILAD